ELLHGRRVDPFDRSIDTIVSRLRHKLSSHFDGEIIQSVRGKGYVLLMKN
ncbi:MAG: helix-turn-helix domain-containing protein, partial [Gammaproteobacteria bacterium]|nr:helix-turn-helix domain-containing protein [Gammaproteobacteria bacterium]